MKQADAYQYDISVIVPIYNVEEYLEKCLDSLLCQGNVSLEIIMVDDGSPDRCGLIADNYATKYESFYCYHIENGGLGNARNYGVTKAHGKYIAFLDSDDYLTKGIYEKMFRAAEDNQCEMAICHVVRFNSSKTIPSALHERAFLNYEPVTHISHNPELVYDTTSWNKLILRSFYLENQFKFPTDILYEDIPVTIPLHFKCKRVAMIYDVGYMWRMRDGAKKSITQQTTSLKNLKDRIKILHMLDLFYEKNVFDSNMHRWKQIKALEIDLFIFVSKCVELSAQQAYETIDLINQYINETSNKNSIAFSFEENIKKLPLIKQQAYEYVRKKDLNGLIKLLEVSKQCRNNFAVIEDYDNSDLLIDMPNDLFTITSRSIKNELSKTRPIIVIESIEIEDSLCRIQGVGFYKRVSITTNKQQEVSACLYNEVNNTEIPLVVEPSNVGRYLTAEQGTLIDKSTEKLTHYNYNGTGFRIILDYNLLARELGEIEKGVYRILVTIKNQFLTGSSFLTFWKKSSVSSVENRTVFFNSIAIKTIFDLRGIMELHLDKSYVSIDSINIDAGKVIVKLNKPVRGLCLKDKGRKKSIEFLCVGECEYSLTYELLEAQRSYYICTIENEDETVDHVLFPTGSSSQWYIENGIIALNVIKTGEASLKLIVDPTIVLKARKVENRLQLITRRIFSFKIKKIIKAEICLFDKITESYVVIAVAKKLKCRNKLYCLFNIDFSNDAIIKNLYHGKRYLIVRYHLDAGQTIQELLYRLLPFKEEYKPEETLTISCYRTYGLVMRILAKQMWEKRQSSVTKRKALIHEEYPKYLDEPVHPKRILFESMWGKQYSCNPQALYEYIDKNYPEYECIWSLKDARTPIKGKAIRVRTGSLQYYYYLATSRYLINNVNYPGYYKKRDDQIEIQTMHGTPLKTLGLDVQGDFPTDAAKEIYIEKNHRWDYLIVQGKFMEGKAKTCFDFENQFLKTGYPRTDKLLQARDKKEQMKEKLGLPTDKKVILYAPTWRVKNRFEMCLNLEKMYEMLADRYVLVVRLHHYCAKSYKVPEDREFLYDMTKYRCVEDLYLAADILVTDYSSVMFDFALLDRPMVFFAYDIEEYEEELRGLYVDFKNEAPGPIVYSTEEVIRAIIDIESEMKKNQERVDQFKRKYLGYERADSCKKILDVLGIAKA